MRIARQVVFALVLIAAGCGNPVASSSGSPAATTPALTGSVLGPSVGINVANGTGLTVVVYVNGSFARSFEPGQGALLMAGALPAMPWDVVARTSSGRVLTSMTVHESDATWTDGVQTGVSYRTVAARVDLSCGRLDVWAGTARPMGPQGGPGSPGDCEP